MGSGSLNVACLLVDRAVSMPSGLVWETLAQVPAGFWSKEGLGSGAN